MSAELDAKTLVDAAELIIRQENRATNAERDRDQYKAYQDAVSPEIENLRILVAASASNGATVNPA